MNADAANKADIVGGSDVDDDGRRATGTTGATCSSSCSPSPSNDVRYKCFFEWNPDAPKFVPNCFSCHNDVLVGRRYHCNQCDVDFCQNCFDSFGDKPPLNHTLEPMSISDSEPVEMTEEQRLKQRSIELHMRLLFHSSECYGCQYKNCKKMKDFLEHEATTCLKKALGACKVCQRVTNLLYRHAGQCRLEECKVRNCKEIRATWDTTMLLFVLQKLGILSALDPSSFFDLRQYMG